MASGRENQRRDSPAALALAQRALAAVALWGSQPLHYFVPQCCRSLTRIVVALAQSDGLPLKSILSCCFCFCPASLRSSSNLCAPCGAHFSSAGFCRWGERDAFGGVVAGPAGAGGGGDAGSSGGA